VQFATDEKKRASKNIVALAQNLLRANDISFDDLLFFAANQGPGPFTTLRVIIATVNGFGFATQKPIIGIDGLDAILDEYRQESPAITVALLNAYSGDLYFGIDNQENGTREKGYAQATVFLSDLKTMFPEKKILFVGQAVTMYLQEIKNLFGENAIIQDSLPEHCSIEQIGVMAWERWLQKDDLVKQLFPLYLKSMSFGKKAPSHF
ncbi:unnamed protein product, partial [marine sediment metagenome]